MVIVDTFTIYPAAEPVEAFTCFDCAGSIDAHAAPVLEEFRSQLDGSDVLLDFSRVERVNSMGLSLLLKLFEEREQQGCRIQVRNLNRMTNMLFKITGLGRFVEGQSGDGGGPFQVQPVSVSGPERVRSAAEPPRGATLKFMANLQTGQQLSGWYLLNTYLQRRLERPIHLEQPQLGRDLQEASVDLLFSKPFDVCSLIRNQGFVPLMRPIGDADEVVILMRADDSRKLEGLDKPSVVTVSENSFVYLLGRSLCDESGLHSNDFRFQFAGNEIKALQTLVKGQADVLFMLKKTYEGLSSFARGATRVIDESSTQFAFHFFCAAPYLGDLYDPLIQIFQEMGESEQGRQVLNDIQIEGWCRPDEGEISMLQRLYSLYITS
ncbi:MAG: PhnD/SsuA/transferrin family substrate-binding protein [Gammaproteobacteria bacterium]